MGSGFGGGVFTVGLSLFSCGEGLVGGASSVSVGVVSVAMGSSVE